jgi:hypothetical protein
MKYIKMLFAWIWLLFANDNKKEERSSKLFLPMKLQYFSDGGDGGGEGGNGDEGGSGGSGDEPFATFKTQDDFNKRLGRAEKKGQKELAKSLGFDSVEDMQAAVNKNKNKENNNNNPNDTDPVDVDALVDAKLKEQLKTEQDKTFKRLVNSEVKLNANELGFADWEDALALADLSQVKEDDKGNIVGVKEALEELGKKKPHLLKQSGNGSFGANVPNSQQQQKEALDNMKKLAASRGNAQTTSHNPWA